MKWVISLFRKNSTDLGLQVGSRVRTSVGRGVITSGCISVKYDEGIIITTSKGAKRHPNDRSLAHNLDKITLED